MSPERIEYQPKVLHPDRKLVTPIDLFRGGTFAYGTIVSGGIVSGGGLNLAMVSGPVNLKPFHIHMFNNEAGWLEIQFRDGGAGGSIITGPYRVLPFSERDLKDSEVYGRQFTSSIYAEVRSGWTGQPLSTGVNISMGYVKEPRDFYE